MADVAYGHSLSARVGAERSATLDLGCFPKAGIAVTRTAWDDRQQIHHAEMPLESAVLLCLDLRDLPRHPYWVGGKATEMPTIAAGAFTLLDLRQLHASQVCTALDRLAVYLPYAALLRYADEHETSPVNEFRIAPGQVIRDPVVTGLLSALLPALDRPQEADRLFLDHVGQALIAHLTATYGTTASGRHALANGGLAAWQERRAKDAMLADIARTVRLDELAALCGLSRSHFARAFKQSTGLPPHQWLTAQRIERVQHLLLTSTLSLDGIAAACGFADQGHLSRAFRRQIGIPPSAWRRLRRF